MPMNESEAQEPVFALAGRSRDPWRRDGQAHRHPCRFRVPGRQPLLQGQTRGALSFPRLFDPRPAPAGLRGRARGQPPVRARNLSPRRADHARTGRPSRARRRRHAGRMGCRDAPFRRGSDPRPPGRGGTRSTRPLADALGRTVAAAHATAPRSRCRSLGESAGRTISTSTSRPSARRPICSARRRRRPRAREPRRLCPHSSAAARARAPRPRPPHPRRSPSRQYRPARGPAGAVRCHRIQPADRVGRRALRSGISADGFEPSAG